MKQLRTIDTEKSMFLDNIAFMKRQQLLEVNSVVIRTNALRKWNSKPEQGISDLPETALELSRLTVSLILSCPSNKWTSQACSRYSISSNVQIALTFFDGKPSSMLIICSTLILFFDFSIPFFRKNEIGIPSVTASFCRLPLLIFPVFIQPCTAWGLTPSSSENVFQTFYIFLMAISIFFASHLQSISRCWLRIAKKCPCLAFVPIKCV